MTFFATVVATVYLFVDHPQGVLSAAGHGHSLRDDRGGAGRLVPRDVPAAGGGRQDRDGGPRGRDDGDGARGRRRQHGAEPGAHVHHPQARGRARRQHIRGDFAASAQARAGQGVADLSVCGAGRDGRRPLRQDAVPVHASGRQSRRAQCLGAQSSRQAEVAGGIARRRHRPGERRHDPDAENRSRHGLEVRHSAAADRRHALRRLRPARGDAILHPGEHLLGGRGGAALLAGRSRHARQDLHPFARPPGRWSP